VGTLINDLVFHDSLWHASPSVGILPGEVAGTVAGLVLARNRQGSEGQAFATRVGGVAGAALPGAAYYVVTGRTGRRDQSVMAALGSAGSIAGTLLAARAVRDSPLSLGRGCLFASAGFAGALAGAGAGYGILRSRRGAVGVGIAGTAAGLACGLYLAQRLPPERTSLWNKVKVDCDALVALITGFASHRGASAKRLVTVRF
jgi:hypothetical protein